MAYQPSTIIEIVAARKELPKQVTKADLVKAIEYLLQQRLPETRTNVENKKLFKVTCAKWGCRNQAMLPKDKASNWHCANHR